MSAHEKVLKFPVSLESSSMTAQISLPLEQLSLINNSANKNADRDRRTRLRVQIEIQVRVRGGHGSKEMFEDVAKTINVTRDGLLLTTNRQNYFVGQALEVTCPFWENPTAINTPRRAKVIRAAIMPDLRYAVALQYVGPLSAHSDELAQHYAPTPFLNQIRILAIESDPEMAYSIRSMLEHDGYNVVVVGSACEALSILATETPDALLIEAEGQDICGKDLCAIVKTSPRLQHIPIIFLTSSALPSDYAAGHRLGAIVCMTKPCKPMHIRRAVHLVAPPPGERTVYSARFNVSSFVRTS
jgi:CheY-like chemotaxis protein